MVTNRIIGTMVFALMLAACGKSSEPTKTAEQQKTEKDAASKAVRDNPVYGDQFKAMDKAKASTEEAVKKSEDAMKKAEQAEQPERKSSYP